MSQGEPIGTPVDDPKPPPPLEPTSGTKLGGYLIEGLLGKGGMGAVYRAVQVSLNRRVALKVMAPHLMGSEESVARFWREARAAAAINHPNLVQVYDFGEADGIYFYAMELVDGLSLGVYLRRGDRFTERECVEVGREVMLALRAAHRAGVIHRDLKPDNLLLNSEGVVKVADLGVARFLAEGAEEPSVSGGGSVRAQDLRQWDSLTVTGRGMGTPAFMSPEQIRGAKDIDQRSDFYALGATLFQLATCRVPYPGRTSAEILQKQFTAPVPRARDINPALGEPFSNLIGRLMAKSPEERPQSHEEILEALEGCLRVVKAEAAEVSRIRMADAPKSGSLAGFLPSWAVWTGVSAALGVIGFLLMRQPAGPDPWETLRQERRSEAASAPRKTDREPTRPHPIGTGRTSATTSTTNRTPPSVARTPTEVPKASPMTPETPSPAAASTAAPVAQEPVTPRVSQADLAAATKEKPFVNSLGMKFVPVPGTKVLFCIWETRVKDFEVFVKDNGYNWCEKPVFEQTPDDPVVMVNRDDANAFCAWLSKKEGLECRLPTDAEWDAAVGRGKYPWGDDWPPPKGVENIGGEESKLGRPDDPKGGVVKGCKDDHPRTSPVGSYRANKAGMYDMGGNVREWVEDRYTEALYRKHMEGGGRELKPEWIADIKKGDVFRVSRGGNWNNLSSGNLVSSDRPPRQASERNFSIGFRCVVAVSSPFPELTEAVPEAGAAVVSATPASSRQVTTETASGLPPSVLRLSSATKERPFVNSLGMKFVPIPGTKVLFSVWETRVKDFEAFVKVSGYNWNERPPFEQQPDHPVVRVSHCDAKAFCAWLSNKEGCEYRLPTDEEWDAAAGKEEFPWGKEWPPPKGTDNFAGDESKLGESCDPQNSNMIKGYRDDHPRIAPVGSYKPLKNGLYNLCGNAREWCEDWYTEAIYKKHKAGDGADPKGFDMADIAKGNVHKLLRGGAWDYSSRGVLRSSFRDPGHPEARHNLNFGFRCVVVASSPFPALAEAAPVAAARVVATAPAPPPQAATRESSRLRATTTILSFATKERPFVNSLGMPFVPIPGSKVLFCIWETRVKDFEVFVKRSKYAWSQKPPFKQTPDDPVVMVSWNDANAFCAWLSKKEGMEYRLPTDEEWDTAVGKDKYPWSDEWPPPTNVENIAGEESKLGDSLDTATVLAGYKDNHPRTAPVGSYKASKAGLYDMGGNVRELVEDWYTEAHYEKHKDGGADDLIPELVAEIKKGNARRISRGGEWLCPNAGSLVSSRRCASTPSARGFNVGIRCVVVASSP